MSPNRKCIVLMPVGSNIERPTEASIMQLKDRGYSVMIRYDVSDINKTRSYMATKALAEGYEELMWIDSDIVFDPNSVDRLRSHDLPCTCGLYSLKRPEGGIAGVLCGDCKELTFGPSGGLTEIRYAATGFLHTRREVYEAIKDKFNLPLCENGDDLGDITPYFFPMIVHDGGGYRYLGEDLSFCERIRQAGYKIHADTTIRLGHIGKYWYSWEDMAGDRSRAQTFELELE